MKIRYDQSVDAAYISFVDDGDSTVFDCAYDYTYACNPNGVGGQIHMDFSASGRLIGIEVLQASKKLPLSQLPSLTVGGI